MQGMAAFAEVFRRPPGTTQHILHPLKYFDHVAPTFPALPKVEPGKGYKDLSEGMLGELDHAGQSLYQGTLWLAIRPESRQRRSR